MNKLQSVLNVQNVLSLRLLKLFACLLVCLFVFSGCTKYEPAKTDSNVDQKSAVVEAPADYDTWPAERKVLYDITKQTGIDFSETLPQKMEWRFNQNNLPEMNTLDGYLMVAEATDKSSELVNKYLETQGFTFDDNNVADGIMGGQIGYQKENTVCTVFSAYSVLSKDKNVKNLSDITVRCGVFNRPIGGDKDAGGCLVGAGYSWCEAKQKCLRVWEEQCK